MLPIYGAAAEATRPLRDRARREDWPWWQRGLVWTAGIYAVEAASGELLRRMTGEVPWDYSRARGGKPVPATGAGWFVRRTPRSGSSSGSAPSDSTM